MPSSGKTLAPARINPLLHPNVEIITNKAMMIVPALPKIFGMPLPLLYHWQMQFHLCPEHLSRHSSPRCKGSLQQKSRKSLILLHFLGFSISPETNVTLSHATELKTDPTMAASNSS